MTKVTLLRPTPESFWSGEYDERRSDLIAFGETRLTVLDDVSHCSDEFLERQLKDPEVVLTGLAVNELRRRRGPSRVLVLVGAVSAATVTVGLPLMATALLWIYA